MQNYQEILYRLKQNQSIRQIHRETKTHKTIIRQIKSIAETKDWLNPHQPLATVLEIKAVLGSATKAPPHILEGVMPEIKEWVQKGYSYAVMESLLKDRLKVSRSTIRRFVIKHFPKAIEPTMMRSFKAGEVAEVDFGYLGVVYDSLAKKNRKAFLFSMRLRYSRKAYRQVVFDQTQKTFFSCHIHAFEYFGGVPAKVVLDNLKAGVIQASMSDPLMNTSYLELARHYGFLASPCDPYMPRHKGGVENDIKYVKGNFWPIFQEKEKLKGRLIPSTQGLDAELNKWQCSVAEKRLISGVGKTVEELFDEEACNLQALPRERFDPIVWQKAKVGSDWRICFESAYYSVPYTFIGKEVMLCAGTSLIKIFFNYEEIAQHERALQKWEYKRKKEHAPEQHEDVLQANRESLQIRCELMGGAIQEFVEHLLADKVQDRLKAARLLLNLEKRYGHIRLEAACKRAIQFEAFSYQSVRNILEKKLDFESIEKKPEPPCQNFRFARPQNYFET